MVRARKGQFPVTFLMLNGRGLAFAALAALLWGFVPVYIAAVGAVDPIEMVVHRALWSAVILLLLLLCLPGMTGGLAGARAALATPGLRRNFAASCALLTVNWVVFVYAVQSRQVLDAALGYFIYPLVTVLLGMSVFRERLDRWGWVAVAIVAVGVMIKALGIGGVPWIAAVLAVSFALYGVVRKRMGVDSMTGLFVETAILVPPSIGYLWWMQASGKPIFFGGGTFNVIMALLAGVVTVVPLILYHAGNRALPLSVASLMFYINPTTQLLIGVFYFGAAFPPREAVVFGLIWTGLVVYFATRRGPATP